jgi:hypothetical protein
MIASRSRALFGAALLALLCGIPALAPAQVETSEPILLLPPATDGLLGDEPAPPDEPVSETPFSSSVEIETLPAFDTDSVGLLDSNHGGLGPYMWEGSRRTRVVELIRRLPASASSIAMHDLGVRILLSAAPSPAGESAEGFLVLRVEALMALGEHEKAVELLGAAPGRDSSQLGLRVQTETRLLGADLAGACEHVAHGAQKFDDPYWQKAAIFCQIVAGQTDAAALGLGLLVEEGSIEDPAFTELAYALIGGQKVSDFAAPNMTPLHLAMVGYAEGSVAPSALAAMPPALLKATALWPGIPMELRLIAAERAEAMGVLATAALGDLYAAVEFSAEDLANPLTRATEMAGVEGRALLYQAVRAQSRPIERAEILERALAIARVEGRYAAVVRLDLDYLLAIEPAGELAWFAGAAARALVAAGRHESANAWFGLARQQAARDPEADRAIIELWPLTALANGGPELDRAMLSSWWNVQSERPDLERRARAGFLFTLFDALGFNLPEDYWDPLLPGPARETKTVPAPAMWQALGRAAVNLRRGETALISLLVLGTGGPAAADEPMLAAVSSSLRRVGLEADARAIAIEAALAAGF